MLGKPLYMNITYQRAGWAEANFSWGATVNSEK